MSLDASSRLSTSQVAPLRAGTADPEAAVWGLRVATGCLLLMAMCFWQAPGLVVPDTKLDLTADPVGLMSRHDLKDNLNRFQIFDARTAEEYRGEDLKGNARGGHLPGAAHLDHRDLLDSGHLRAPSELATMIENAGIDSSRPVVTHCNGGGRAALAALAALAAGQKDVRVYYLSFADWAADESCSLE